MQQVLLFVSGLLGVLSFVPYIMLIARRIVRPVRVTWTIWAIILWVSLVAQLRVGATHTLVFAAVDTIGVTLIVLLSFIYGKKGYTRIDIVCLIIALMSIVGWWIFDDARIGIYLSIVADICAALPLVVHAYKRPDEEDSTTFLLFACGGLMNLLTVTDWRLEVVAFPVYLVCLNISVAMLIRMRQIVKMPYRKPNKILREDYDVVPL